MLLSEIKEAKAQDKKMVWNDPDPIEGNDYEITYIEDLSKYNGFNDEEMEDAPILIQYGRGSEAEVYLSEIALV